MRLEGGLEKKKKEKGLERWGMGPLSGEGHVFPRISNGPLSCRRPSVIPHTLFTEDKCSWLGSFDSAGHRNRGKGFSTFCRTGDKSPATVILRASCI